MTILRRQAQTAGLRWANVYRGMAINADGVRVRALHPEPADWERQKVRNDDSLVLELTWRDTAFLLTGDIGKAVEPAIAASLTPARLRVLKVPHHGSLTSSSDRFVEAVHPAIAVISAGRANHFGHPAPEVLARYQSGGAAVFSTDLDGAVLVETDGYALAVHGFTGRAVSVRE